MQRTGRVRIKRGKDKKTVWKCWNCGGKGTYRVRFEDMYGKLEVTLCEDCAGLEYGQLKLQSRFEWKQIDGSR